MVNHDVITCQRKSTDHPVEAGEEPWTHSVDLCEWAGSAGDPVDAWWEAMRVNEHVTAHMEERQREGCEEEAVQRGLARIGRAVEKDDGSPRWWAGQRHLGIFQVPISLRIYHQTIVQNEHQEQTRGRRSSIDNMALAQVR
jgi:hypothetical protein